MKRRLSCDVPGCGAARTRFQRLCTACYRKLPGDIRVGITEAHHQHRLGDWRRLRNRAAEYLGTTTVIRGSGTGEPQILQRRVSAQRSYELQARMLGEKA